MAVRAFTSRLGNRASTDTSEAHVERMTGKEKKKEADTTSCLVKADSGSQRQCHYC